MIDREKRKRETNIGIERRKKSQNIASSHYQRWLIRDNIFYGKAHEHNLFSYGSDISQFFKSNKRE